MKRRNFFGLSLAGVIAIEGCSSTLHLSRPFNLRALDLTVYTLDDFVLDKITDKYVLKREHDVVEWDKGEYLFLEEASETLASSSDEILAMILRDLGKPGESGGYLKFKDLNVNFFESENESLEYLRIVDEMKKGNFKRLQKLEEYVRGWRDSLYREFGMDRIIDESGKLIDHSVEAQKIHEEYLNERGGNIDFILQSIEFINKKQPVNLNLLYDNVYSLIDLEFQGNRGDHKAEFHIHPFPAPPSMPDMERALNLGNYGFVFSISPKEMSIFSTFNGVNLKLASIPINDVATSLDILSLKAMHFSRKIDIFDYSATIARPNQPIVGSNIQDANYLFSGIFEKYVNPHENHTFLKAYDYYGFKLEERIDSLIRLKTKKPDYGSKDVLPEQMRILNNRYSYLELIEGFYSFVYSYHSRKNVRGLPYRPNVVLSYLDLVNGFFKDDGIQYRNVTSLNQAIDNLNKYKGELELRMNEAKEKAKAKGLLEGVKVDPGIK